MFARWFYQPTLDKERISKSFVTRSEVVILLFYRDRDRDNYDGNFNLAIISFNFSSNEDKHYTIPQLLD